LYEISGRCATQPRRSSPWANADGTITPLTLPNHASLKSSTLRAICTQAQIPRDEFLRETSRRETRGSSKAERFPYAHSLFADPR
jgi:hypothetical protein